MTPRIAACIFIAAIAAASVALASAQHTTEASDRNTLGAALREGGHVIFLRHAQEAGQDQTPVDLEDCQTQQYLTDEGKAQARAIGEQFRRLGIPVGRVLSGRHCRAYDTAVLAFGDAEVLDVLTLTAALKPAARGEQPAALRQLLGTPPEAGTNTVLVSHNGMFMPITGVTVERAEGAIFAVTEGEFTFITVLAWDEWSALAPSN